MDNILTREEFEQLRLEKARELAANRSLKQRAIDLLCEADSHMWIHQANWMGEPALQPAEDLLAIQEAAYKSKPVYIIEVGVAWGGSTLFYSCIPGVDMLICVDKFIPDDLKERICAKCNRRVWFFEGNSTDQEILDKIKDVVGPQGQAMVILDSDHTHAHVFDELILYREFIHPGQYLIVQDTVLSFYQKFHRDRPWGPHNNPETALRQFLETDKTFAVDKEIDNKLLVTCCPGGFLRKNQATT